MLLRIFAFATVVLAANLADSLFRRVVDPSIQTSLAVGAVNGDNTSLLTYRTARDWSSPWLLATYTGAAAALFGPALVAKLKSLKKK